MKDPKDFPRRYPVEPHQTSAEHHTRCPICGHMVDEYDLEEVFRHLEPGHKPPLKN